MLPKKNRLNLNSDFQWAATGKKLDTKFARIFIKTGDNTSPRVGIAVSGKVFKKAHERNKARRLVSQALQSVYSKLPGSINILALPKHHILEVKSSEVLLDLESILKHEKIID